MAMTIVANALVFHASLVGHGGPLADIRSVHRIRAAEGRLSREAVLAEWQKILAINYWPIFDLARQIVEMLPAPAVVEILDRSAKTADLVLESGLTHSHDLVGAIFQTLIADRKFLAAFYTRPASAALLAELAISPSATPRGEDWVRSRQSDTASGGGLCMRHWNASFDGLPISAAASRIAWRQRGSPASRDDVGRSDRLRHHARRHPYHGIDAVGRPSSRSIFRQFDHDHAVRQTGRSSTIPGFTRSVTAGRRLSGLRHLRNVGRGRGPTRDGGSIGFPTEHTI